MNMYRTTGLLAPLLAVLMLVLSGTVLAGEEQAKSGQEATGKSPDELVKTITDRVLRDIETYREAIEEVDDREREKALLEEFYGGLMDTLEPVVDFHWISLNVMGSYREQASDEQRRRFQKVFTRSLVQTYGRGLLTYSDQEITVEPLDEPLGDRRRVTVTQKILGKDQTYPLYYSMGRNREGDWKVINVIINGVNLGKTFRNQFTQAASNHDGDIDKVIENWSVSQEFQS